MEEISALIALLEMEGVGSAHCRSLRQKWGSLAQLWHLPKDAPLFLQPHLPKLSTLRAKALSIIESCEKIGVQIVPFWHKDFPIILQHSPQPPALLYVKGTLPQSHRIYAAVIGTRRPSPYGMQAVVHFTETFVQAGLGIISGLAYGIDGQAHRTCLAAGGHTVAVLAHGLDQIYPPAHRQLAEDILAKGGGWVSEYPPGTPVHPLRFPPRNWLMVRLSQFTVVIESREKGGAMFTARAALEAGRSVYAVPGSIFSPTSQGTHELIAKHIAQIASSPQMVLREIEHVASHLPLIPASPSPLPEGPVEAQIYQFLEEGQRHIDEILAHTGLPIGQLLSVLVRMEVAGWIQQKPGGFVLRLIPPSAISE
ncbi:MAG: DNA-processing protein DprA [Bacteroidia bacterium]|nr:DNA-processing protein DprA [Bacteroidia bacterium]MDW8236215.1 DNA-processing protein DprA [Bacteroidia bacterium]